MKKNTLNVYLAGKINHYDWRQKIVDIRNNFFGNEKADIRNGCVLKYSDNIYIVGPFFLACDHSCYHGDNSHGVGLNKFCPDGSRYDCYGETDYFTEEEVKKICLNQIKNSDVIFAYINDSDCYGTLYELGYAHALNKPILILFENKYKDMWFMSTGAEMVRIRDKYSGVKENFDDMINYYNEKLNK